MRPYARDGPHPDVGAPEPGFAWSLPVRLQHRFLALFGRRTSRPDPAVARHRLPPSAEAASVVRPASPAPGPILPPDGPGAAALPPDGPGTAASEPSDPCGPSRAAVGDACSLADRMSALALAAQDRLREARYAYDQHVDRHDRAAAAADPRAVRAAKDEAQASFRSARLAAKEQGAIERAAREWLREIDRINARTREAVRLVTRENAAEIGLLQAMERLGLEADGGRIAAESAAEACRSARIALAACEETERLGRMAPAGPELLAPASVVARATPPDPPGPAAAGAPADEAQARAAGAAAEPAILPLLAGDKAVRRAIAVTLAQGDAAAAQAWEAHLAALVEAIRERAIDGAALTFPDAAFWAPYTQVEGREIAAALAALGYRFDGNGGFVDGRVPGQRELSLAIGYAGMDPMRVRTWPSEAELPHLYAEVEVDASRFVAEAAGELTLGEMIDLLGRRAEELSSLWNAWGRIRPLLLEPA